MKKNNKNAFSIIEVMIAIFVFAFWLTSVFAMLSWSISMSDYSRNLIVASHLADEQLELFKNIRDSNYKKGKKWDIINPAERNVSAETNSFEVGSYYRLEYHELWNSNSFPTLVKKLPWDFGGWNDQDETYANDNSKLCITPDGQYTYDCSGNKETAYYRYIRVEIPEYSGGQEIENAYKITSTVIWKWKKTHSTEVSTIVTDWKRY